MGKLILPLAILAILVGTIYLSTPPVKKPTDIPTQTALSQLDYKEMDSHGIPHDRIEDIIRLCMEGPLRKTTGDEIAAKICACHANGIAQALTKEEFIAYDDKTRAKTVSASDDAIRKKISVAAEKCRIEYFGN